MFKKDIASKHKEIFGESPELYVYAPGRVNLIGEHTDYSEGYVMPVAINMGITVGISKIEDSNILSCFSLDYNMKMVSSYSDLRKSETEWFNYPIGVVKKLLSEKYKFSGIRLSFTGNLPQGAGLSSSAALEISIAYAINQMFNLNIPDVKLIKICQQAEHEIVGVKCGIMDQFISKMGKKNHALFLDTRSLEYEQIPLTLGSVKLLITNSNVPHRLSESKYNERVSECEEAVKIMKNNENQKYLRDFTINTYNKYRDLLPKNVRKRAFHVISENDRVIKSIDALKSNDFQAFGKLMNESHESLNKYYEVSSPELNWLTKMARSINGAYGSRLTGAGFGGSTITLIEKDSIQEYIEKLNEYEEKFGYKAKTYETLAEDGVHLI